MRAPCGRPSSKGSTCAAATPAASPCGRANGVSAIGATLVKRHSSCFMVGKPSSTKRAIAPSRISLSHAGAPVAPLLAKALKSATYRSVTLVMPRLPRRGPSRSPSLRARAQAPCRPTSRSARRTAREVGRQGACARARREGLRLGPRRGSRGMTSVTERYVADFKAFASNGATGAPAWLKDMREGAIARFVELGFPTMKQEEWRFTSVAPIAETPFARPHGDAAGVAAAQVEPLLLGRPHGARIVFVDGAYAPRLSSVAGLPARVQAGSLAAALRGGGAAGELARQHFARHAWWQQSAFAALNTAFLSDGA